MKDTMKKVVAKYGVVGGALIIAVLAAIIYFTDMDVNQVLQLLGVQ